jgi:hypothetical protein
MGIYEELYDFAASAGAFEGYVYQKDKVDPSYLPRWASNLEKQYNALPADVRTDIQDLCDSTLGRAVQSLVPLLGADHEVVKRLTGMIQGDLRSSPDDFDKH